MTTPDKREKFTRPLDRPGFERPSAGIGARPSLDLPSRRPSQELVVVDQPEETPPPATGALARLFDAISQLLKPKPREETPEPEVVTPPPAQEATLLTLLVASMNGDSADGAGSQALFKAIGQRSALRVKAHARTYALDNAEEPEAVSAVLANTRGVLEAESADLIIWGDITKDGYCLRITGPSMPDENTLFGPFCRVYISSKLDQPSLDFLYASVLAALESSNQAQRAHRRRLLPIAAQNLEAVAAKPPVSYSMLQQRSIQIMQGHVSMANAMALPPSQAGDWFQKAINAYRGAEKRLGRTDPPIESVLISKYLANALTLRAERIKDRNLPYLEEAISHWRNAIEGLNRYTMPMEWAMLQTRLGNTLYRLDLMTGNTELLREALAVLQSSLSVFTKTEQPHRWSENMHLIARVLELYGDQLKNPEVLEKAAEACKSVQDIRTREQFPLAWASTQNTFGSIKFMLARHTGESRHLDEAAEALEAAKAIFETHGAKGPAQVATRNLAHVHKLAEDRKSKYFKDPRWAD